jgi:small subunit ribosomal protein S18
MPPSEPASVEAKRRRIPKQSSPNNKIKGVYMEEKFEKRDRGDRSERGDRNDRGDRGGARPARRKVCMFCADANLNIDYKDIGRIKKFVAENGKILPRRQTNLCAKHQREITTAVKRARVVSLM